MVKPPPKLVNFQGEDNILSQFILQFSKSQFLEFCISTRPYAKSCLILFHILTCFSSPVHRMISLHSYLFALVASNMSKRVDMVILRTRPDDFKRPSFPSSFFQM
eukprot:TRINITY_DN5777_c0_g2_i1.p2 TRINITY_DN5777_c0_g2~~TRINITY_DN5777_c0_g2_i1.p2  ORF type:complete len:105 (-),score=2.78 TRINITY_DN5777_c0_g2_i1:249-563(-)